MAHLALVLTVHAGHSKTVSVKSPSMDRAIKATIVFPDSYRENKKLYSTIYLLHGYRGNHATWPRIVPLREYADRYQVLFVCPDGNVNSWYIDSPRKEDSRFSTFVARELPSFVEENFRAHRSEKGRALLGSSMGGHGALTILADYPEHFRGAGSISGIIDLTQFSSKWDIQAVLGSYDEHQQDWEKHSFLGKAASLIDRDKDISIGCGTEDFALEGNRKAHEVLLRYGIPHDYYERPGDHETNYVKRNAAYHIMFLQRELLPPK